MQRVAMLAAVVLLAIFAVSVADAADTPLNFADPVRQARFEGLLAELRCLVCQNQSLADSHAELAQDLRNEVYAMLDRGMDDRAILAFLVDRYGDFVLYRPPLKAITWALWLGPFVLAGAAAVIVLRRARRPATSVALDAAERERLAALRAATERDTR